MITFRQSQALTSHFESFWSIVLYLFMSPLGDTPLGLGFVVLLAGFVIAWPGW